MLFNKNRVFLLVAFVFMTQARAQLAGFPGAFSRMGFGARGMGIGNAMTAVSEGDVTSFYNPAVTPFLSSRVASISTGFLSLDRSFNALSYSQALRPTAGVSFGILNAGVRNIDGRDSDGFPTEKYSTSENQFSLGFANRLSQHFSVGISIKIYYYSLFEKLSTTVAGIDIGTLIRLSDELMLGIVVQDLGSAYNWDTSTLYGQQGNSTKDKFPVLRRIGLAYTFGGEAALLAVELENSNKKTNIIRGGVEATIIDQLSLRTGFDHFDPKRHEATTPSFGFTARTEFNGWTPALTYAFVVEPYGIFTMHIITLSARF